MRRYADDAGKSWRKSWVSPYQTDDADPIAFWAFCIGIGMAAGLLVGMLA